MHISGLIEQYPDLDPDESGGNPYSNPRSLLVDILALVEFVVSALVEYCVVVTETV